MCADDRGNSRRPPLGGADAADDDVADSDAAGGGASSLGERPAEQTKGQAFGFRGGVRATDRRYSARAALIDRTYASHKGVEQQSVVVHEGEPPQRPHSRARTPNGGGGVTS